MKKFLNQPEDLVVEALRGFANAHSDMIRVDAAQRLCIRRDAPISGKVGIVSGGGSGHEPLHPGFVGAGMLDAAVLGEVFTSPTADQVAAAIRAVDGRAGVLLIVKNYTGDVLNFRLGAELAEDDGIEVTTVVVDDDTALPEGSSPGRRGTAATVIVEKVAGALAERGAPLADVTKAATQVVASARSIGVALTSCTTPAAGRPTFHLPDDEIEFGVGIHGEAGVARQPITAARDLVPQLVDRLLDDLDPPDGDELFVLTNGLGSTPQLELYLVHAEAVQALERRGFRVADSLVGSYVTSLDMAGVSLSLATFDDELAALWHAPVRTPALSW